MRWSADGLYVGPVFGVPLIIHNSLFAIAPFALLFSLRLGSTRLLAISLAALALLLVSVLIHELAHAHSAKRLGVPVRHVALTWYGGFADFWVRPPSRWREALIAFAGPVSNLVLAAFCFLVLAAFAEAAPYFERAEGDVYWRWRNPSYREPAWQVIVEQVAWFNLVLGALNLLPGLPLDGGHILRAGLSTRMSDGRAGWIAAWSGVLIGAALVIYAFWVGSVWALILGAFVVVSAWTEKRRMRYE